MRWIAILCVCMLCASAGELIVMQGGCWAACAGEETQTEDGDGDGDAPDPCSHCGLGCCAPACSIAPPGVRIAPPDLSACLPDAAPLADPPCGELREILHVPRSARA